MTMGPGGMRGGGGGMSGFGTAWKNARKDPSVTEQKLQPGSLRRIGAFARPYRREISVFLGLTVAQAALVVVTPLLLKQIVDVGVIPGDRRVVVHLSLIVAALALASGVLSLWERWMSSRIGEGLIYDLRSEVFGHVQRQPIAFFTRTQTGALVSRLNSDVLGAQQAFTSTLASVVSNVVTLIGVLGAMLYLSWQITLAALVLLPIFWLPAKAVGNRLAGLTRESMQLNAELGNRMTERFNVAGALLVKLYGTADREDTEFTQRAGRVRDIGVRIAMSNRAFFVALTTVAALATAMVYGIGGWLAIDGSLSVGSLLALAALLARLYGPLTALANVRVDIMTALVSFERVLEVLDLQPAVTEVGFARPLPDGELSVRFDNVHFAYPSADEIGLASLEQLGDRDRQGSTHILNGVSFHVDPGKMLALVGPSGAGKTTIASLIARLYDPDHGRVLFSDTPLTDVTFDSLRSRVGVVVQDAHMFHDTVRANLLYAKPGATDDELEEALRSAQVWQVVQSLPSRLETVVGDRGHRLSGGEKQRLALARLFLKAPDIVVLDEATAHLDSESEVAVQRALDKALEGRTSIVIAHRLSTVQAADTIVVIDEGRLVQVGTHNDLMQEGGLYRHLYDTQFSSQVND